MSGCARLLFATGMVSILISADSSASEQSNRSINNLSAAQELLITAFPETTAANYKGQVSASGTLETDWTNWVLIGVSVYVNDPKSPSHSRRVLGGRLHVSNGKVGEAYFEGEFVSSAAVTKVAKEVRERASWTADDMKSALVAAGAKFTSQGGEEFLHVAKVVRFASMLGSITKSTARFIAEPPIKDNVMNAEFEPMWLVTLDVSAGKEQGCYDLTFEPFNGQLTSIVKRLACQ